MFSRPQKSHLGTVQYEIDMLNHCYEKLLKEKWQDTPDNNISLECFLLHYRNLIEFFGDSADLKPSESEVWSPRSLPSEELASIQDRGPYDKYWRLISQYLQHCTKSRIRDRGWDVKEMYVELKGVLDNFRRLFPVQPIAKTVAVLTADSKSTASFSTPTMTVIDSGLNAHQGILPEGKKPSETQE